MDSIISLLLYGILFYVVFKLGEHTAYFRVARGLSQLKQQARADSGDAKHSTTVIEKIGDQYYTYIDDEFIGQGSTMDQVTTLVQDVIVKNPNKFGVMKVVVKE